MAIQVKFIPYDICTHPHRQYADNCTFMRAAAMSQVNVGILEKQETHIYELSSLDQSEWRYYGIAVWKLP